MARQNAPLLAFNRGEVSKLALARIDLAKMALAAECQVNWLPFVLGAAMLRPGLKQIGETASDNACEIVDFIYAKTDTALIELTDSLMRVWINDALVTRNSVATSVTNGSFASSTGWTLSPGTGSADINSTVAGALYLAAGATGDSASCLRSVSVAGPDQNVEHALRIVVLHGPVDFLVGSTSGGDDYIGRTTLGTGTHSLVFTPSGASFFVEFISALRYGVSVDSIAVEASGTMTVPTPWAAADLPNLRWTQSLDTIWVAAYGKTQYKIERRGARPGARGWSVVNYLVDDGPFDDANTNTDTSRTIAASDSVGSVTLTAVNTSFSSNDVGTVIRLEESDLSLVASWKAAESITIPTTAGVLTGTKIGDMTNPANAFDGNAATAATKTAGSGYIGTSEVSSEAVYSCTFSAAVGSGAVPMNFTLYGKVGSAPASATDGTALGTALPVLSAATQAFTIYSVNNTTAWDHIWLAWSSSFVPALSIFEITRLKFSSGGSAVYRRSFGRVYQALAGTTSGVNAPTHSSGDVLSETGGMVWRYVHGLFGTARITAVASASSASADVLQHLPISVALRATSGWTRSDWNAGMSGYPSSVALQEGRLWWFGSRFWGSGSGRFTSFAQTDDVFDTLGDAGAIVESFGEGPADRINWGLGLTRLLCGREGSVASIRSSSFDTPLTPTDLQVKDCSEQPAERLAAVKVGKRGIFVTTGGRVHELFFNPQAADYDTRDLTRFNIDIAAPGFVAVAHATQPDTTIFWPRSDGQVAALLYAPNDEVEAWWRIMTLGVVENARKLPRSTGGDDHLYFCVKRTINGVTRRFIERMAQRSSCVGGSLNAQADCHLSITQASSATITGLSSLEGQSVVVWANGKSLGSYTVTGGSITVSEAVTTAIVGLGGVIKTGSTETALRGGSAPDQVFSSNSATLTVGTAYNGYPAEVWADVGGTGKLAHVGALTVAAGAVTLPNGAVASVIVAMLGYVAPFQSAKLAYAAQLGTPLTQKKIVHHVGLALYDTHYQGVQYGQRFDALDPLPAVEEGQVTPANTVWSEYDQPMFELAGEWDTDTRLCLLAQAPTPCKLGAVVVDVKTNG